MLVDHRENLKLEVSAFGPVPDGYPLPSNDIESPQETVLVAGAPFKAQLTVSELAGFVLRFDRICLLYSALSRDQQMGVDHLVLASLRTLLPLHERICSWLDSQPEFVRDNRASITREVACIQPVPLGLTALASMILAADAAIDTLRRNQPTGIPYAQWSEHYRKHLRKTLNRVDDLCSKGRAIANKQHRSA